MKTILTTALILFTVSTGFGQSKYDFPIGFDSLAYAHKIKSKSTYHIRIDSASIDTNTLEIHEYDTLGFLTRIEVLDLYNIKRNQNHATFPFKNTAQFQYNESGYLIDESVNWSGPVGWLGKDTIRKRQIEDWVFIENTELLLHTETINRYPKEDEWFEKCDYYYHLDNRLDSVVCFTGKEDESFRNVTQHKYDKQGLLIETNYKNTFGIYRKILVYYEFYD